MEISQFYLKAAMIGFIFVATLMHKWLFMYVPYNVILMILCVGNAQYLNKSVIHIRLKFAFDGRSNGVAAVSLYHLIGKHYINKSIPYQHCQSLVSSLQYCKRHNMWYEVFCGEIVWNSCSTSYHATITKPRHSYFITIFTKKNTTASLKLAQMSQMIK